jgi:DNA-binding transcriptional LysR family regulator
MDLDCVETFYWVATLRSYAGAAKKMHVGDRTVAFRIEKSLERDLGVKLIDHGKRPLQLTAAGMVFLGHAEQLLKQRDAARRALGSCTEQVHVLRIGAIESVLHGALIPWLELLRRTQPGLQLELTIETTDVLQELVRRGALDLVLAALPVLVDGVRTRALPSLPMTFVGSTTLHDQQTYLFAQLAAYDLLTFQRGSHPHAQLLALLRAGGIETARVHTSSSISAMMRLVAGGFGVATLPVAALEQLPAPSGLRQLACELTLAPLPIHASWRPQPSSNALDVIVDQLASYLQP